MALALLPAGTPPAGAHAASATTSEIAIARPRARERPTTGESLRDQPILRHALSGTGRLRDCIHLYPAGPPGRIPRPPRACLQGDARGEARRESWRRRRSPCRRTLFAATATWTDMPGLYPDRTPRKKCLSHTCSFVLSFLIRLARVTTRSTPPGRGRWPDASAGSSTGSAATRHTRTSRPSSASRSTPSRTRGEGVPQARGALRRGGRARPPGRTSVVRLAHRLRPDPRAHEGGAHRV